MKQGKLISKITRLGIVHKIASPPGTVVEPNQIKREDTDFQYTYYTKEAFGTKNFKEFSPDQLEPDPVNNWIHINGMKNHQNILSCLHYFGVHPLVQEDIFNLLHRPKFESQEKSLFLTLKMPRFDAGTKELDFDQFSIIQTSTNLISIAETDIPELDLIIERIQNPSSRFRRFGPDYLNYALIDLIADQFIPIISQIDSVHVDLEEEISLKTDAKQLERLQIQKKNLILMRQNLLPIRDLVLALLKESHELIHPNQIKYFKDVLDHLHLSVDQLQSLKDQNANLMETYLGLQSMKMNEVMKTLTIIATIFIPLTFMAGIYGMNFDNMPELHWTNGYFVLLSAMLLVAILLLLFFRRRKWL